MICNNTSLFSHVVDLRSIFADKSKYGAMKDDYSLAFIYLTQYITFCTIYSYLTQYVHLFILKTQSYDLNVLLVDEIFLFRM